MLILLDCSSARECPCIKFNLIIDMVLRTHQRLANNIDIIITCLLLLRSPV